jgi:hypothetical protein
MPGKSTAWIHRKFQRFEMQHPEIESISYVSISGLVKRVSAGTQNLASTYPWFKFNTLTPMGFVLFFFEYHHGSGKSSATMNRTLSIKQFSSLCDSLLKMNRDKFSSFL